MSGGYADELGRFCLLILARQVPVKAVLVATGAEQVAELVGPVVGRADET